jgi:hypothetical protein
MPKRCVNATPVGTPLATEQLPPRITLPGRPPLGLRYQQDSYSRQVRGIVPELKKYPLDLMTLYTM